MSSRIALIATGLAFGLWEAVDIFWIDVPAFAAAFAVLFLGCTLWFWRRGSARAAVALMVLFAFEAAAAPTLNAMTVTKTLDLALALAGLACGLAVLIAARHGKRSSGHGLAETS